VGWVCLAAGLILTMTAAIASSDSIFAWINASACIVLAAASFALHLKASVSPQRADLQGDGSAGKRANVFLLLVLLSVSSPLIKTGIEVVGQDAASGQGQAAAGAAIQPVINKLYCPALAPGFYTCRHGRCWAEGR